MSTVNAHITTDRECDHCGYNLKGLAMGSKCPECGHPIRRMSAKTSGTMSDEAPTRFVRTLRLGFALASAAIIGTVVLSFSPWNLGVITTGFWVGGIWLITSKRPGQGTIRPDKVLDSDRTRMGIRLASLAWPAYTLLSMALLALVSANTGSAFLVIMLTVLLVGAGIVAWGSLIPTSVYMAEIAYWAAHDNLADRLRGTAWVMAVFGTITALLAGLGMGLGMPAALFISVPAWLVIFIAIIVFGFTVIQMATVMHWVIKHQHMAAGSFDRVRARIERETAAPGRVANNLVCQTCGYDLNGLPHGGDCPECGASYADLTPMPVRDPAKTPSYHDNSDLELADGPNKGVFFNDQLDASGKPKATGVPYTPRTEVPDEGDIPLAMEDDEHPGASENDHAHDHPPALTPDPGLTPQPGSPDPHNPTEPGT